MKAFTIVEILITVAVIVILTALGYVLYSGITRQAAEASMRSDLEAARNSIAFIKNGQKNYPTSAATANNGKGLAASGGNEIFYGAQGTSYCVYVKNAATPLRFQFRSTRSVIEEGNCGGSVSTFVGSGSSLAADGVGTAAAFDWIGGLTQDPDGNLYVGECNGALRKVTPNGTVTTFAGALNTSAYVDGNSTTARFQCIEGLTMDDDGNIYASVYGTLFTGIRKITPTGDVSTIAGSATRGNADGNGTAAQFWYPFGLAVDDAGILYVADGGYGTIRKITPSGDVSTFVGSTFGYNDATGTAALLGSVHGIDFDSAGNLYIADSTNHRIRKMTPAGVVTTFAGSGSQQSTDGNGTSASFHYPTGLAIDDDDNVYVYDATGLKLRKITPSGDVTTVAGSGSYGSTNGVGLYSTFTWMETGLVVDPSGVIYIGDSDNYAIRKIEP